MQRKYESRGVSFLLLNLSHGDGESEGEELVTRWLTGRGGEDLPVAVEHRETTKRLHRLGGQEFNTIPSTVLLTREGKVSDILGIYQPAELEAAIERLVQQ
jgi:hypothetical protein